VSPLPHRRCNNHRTQLWPYSNRFAVAIVPKMSHGVLVAAIAQGGGGNGTSRFGNVGVHLSLVVLAVVSIFVEIPYLSMYGFWVDVWPMWWRRSATF
jgi:hypothetical protein